MPGKMLPPPPSTKRPMRLRSIQGQNGGNQKKKGGGGGGGGKGGKTKPYSQDGKNKPEVYIDPKSSNAPIFLISKCNSMLSDTYCVSMYVFDLSIIAN